MKLLRCQDGLSVQHPGGMLLREEDPVGVMSLAVARRCGGNVIGEGMCFCEALCFVIREGESRLIICDDDGAGYGGRGWILADTETRRRRNCWALNELLQWG